MLLELNQADWLSTKSRYILAQLAFEEVDRLRCQLEGERDYLQEQVAERKQAEEALRAGAGRSRTRQPREQPGRADCLASTRSQATDCGNHLQRQYLLALAISRSTRFGEGAGGCVKDRTRRKACG
jgi:hypothetical protein